MEKNGKLIDDETGFGTGDEWIKVVVSLFA
jgi:hypothetical protein